MTPEQLAFVRRFAPPIPPAPAGPRPFWSVVVPSFRPDFLEQTLESILVQDRGPEAMQIEVMDDGSPDDEVRDIVERVGRGRIACFRQPANLGQFANINAGIARARGRWVHVLHDDDWIEDGFYIRLEEHLAKNDGYGAAMTALTIAWPAEDRSSEWPLLRSDPGLLPDAIRHFATTLMSQPPAVVVRREVYETLGGFSTRWQSPGDWEMWQRIAAHYDWFYEPRARAFYRAQGVSVSSTAKRTGADVREAAEIIDLAQGYLPADRAGRLRDAARQQWATLGLNTARRALSHGQMDVAAAQIIEALKIAPSRPTLARLVTLGCPPTPTRDGDG